MSNVPFMKCLDRAKATLRFVPDSEVYQKFTCDKCQSRQTLPEPNTFYTHATCEECSTLTDIYKKGCGYAMISGPGTKTPRVMTVSVSAPYKIEDFRK